MRMGDKKMNKEVLLNLNESEDLRLRAAEAIAINTGKTFREAEETMDMMVEEAKKDEIKVEKEDFLKQVTETVLTSESSVVEAILTTGERLKIRNSQLEEWFGRELYEKELDTSRRKLS